MSLSMPKLGEGLRKLLATLSPEQREAVTASAGVLLIDAGAGSGKTLTLTGRIAYLLASGVRSRGIIAATFTRAAASSLEKRLREITKADVRVCTLHSWAQQIFQRSLSRPVEICDEYTARALVAQVLKDGHRTSPRSVLSEISRAKNLGMTPRTYQASDKFATDDLPDLWEQYEQLKGDRLDFDDLLVKSLHLLHTNTGLLSKYHRTWAHLLIDEFQDTNSLQYALIRSVFEGRPVSCHGDPCHASFRNRSLTVVGDPDQAIYGFRGGNVDLIVGFPRDYPACQVVHMGKNYRSQPMIVRAAAAVISNNAVRLAKDITAQADRTAKPIRLVTVVNASVPEIVGAICRRLWKESRGQAQITALFRHNDEMERLHQGLMALGIPARQTGGLFFEDLPEVRAVLAILEASRDPRNDYRLFEASRALLPPDKRLPYPLRQRLHRDQRQGRKLSLWDVVATAPDEEAVIVRDALLATIEVRRTGSPLRQVLEACRQTQWLSRLHGSSHQSRDTLNELAKRLLSTRSPRDPVKALSARSLGFLELMTIHKSKGLEREYVILPCEEGVFPDPKSSEEEERRLFYVGMTRAQRQLYIIARKPSRFVKEIPADMVSRTTW
jgi:DNA helicase-2/ATP-dependent DNA helicase PcrA